MGKPANKAAIAGIVGLLIGLVGGYGAGRVSTGTPINPLAAPGSGSGSYQDGYNAAKKKIDDAHMFPPAPTSALSLTGTVKSLGSDSLVMEVSVLSPNPLDEMTVPKERTVTVTGSTKILKLITKSPNEFEKDLEAFQKAVAEGTPATAPSNTKQVPISLQDLKAGDTVNVTADHDILKEVSFTAVEIDLFEGPGATGAIQPVPPAPTALPPASAVPPEAPSPDGANAPPPGRAQ